MDNFGTRLQFLRKQKGLSLQELAEKIDSTKSTLSKYERGKVEPTLDSAKKIANYFCVTVDWLSGRGPIEEAAYDVPQKYIDVVKKAIEFDISAEKLSELINIAIKIKED